MVRPIVRLRHSCYGCALALIKGSFVAFAKPVKLIIIIISGAPALTAESVICCEVNIRIYYGIVQGELLPGHAAPLDRVTSNQILTHLVFKLMKSEPQNTSIKRSSQSLLQLTSNWRCEWR